MRPLNVKQVFSIMWEQRRTQNSSQAAFHQDEGRELCVGSYLVTLWGGGLRFKAQCFVHELETWCAGRLPRDFSNPLIYLNYSREVCRGQRMVTIPPPSIYVVLDTWIPSAYWEPFPVKATIRVRRLWPCDCSQAVVNNFCLPDTFHSRNFALERETLHLKCAHARIG